MDQLKQELIAWLDQQKIHSENIGNIRRQCFVPWSSKWNSIVRDETAIRERVFDPYVDWSENTLSNPFYRSREPVEAENKRGRIYVLKCPGCARMLFHEIVRWRKLKLEDPRLKTNPNWSNPELEGMVPA